MDECDSWFDQEVNNNTFTPFFIPTPVKNPVNQHRNYEIDVRHAENVRKTENMLHKITEHENTINRLKQDNFNCQSHILSLQSQLKFVNNEKTAMLSNFNKEKDAMLSNFNKEKDAIEKINASLTTGRLEDFNNANKKVIDLNNEFKDANTKLIHVIDVQKREIDELKKTHTESLHTIELQQHVITTLREQPKEVKAPRKLMNKNVIDLLTKDEETKIPYNWEGSVKANHEKCIDVYGFTSEQIKDISKNICSGKGPKNHKSRKSKRSKPTKDLFLAFLYFFTRYPTIKVISDNFGMAQSSAQNRILEFIETYSTTLFRKSISSPNDDDSDTFTFDESSDDENVLSVHFLETNRPKCDNTGAKYYCTKYEKYGVYIRCLHDKKTHKVTDYYVEYGSKTGICDECLSDTTYSPKEWKNMYQIDKDVQRIYKNRMEGKFLIFASKYRGDLSSLPFVIKCLVALTNFDIHYNNATT